MYETLRQGILITQTILRQSVILHYINALLKAFMGWHNFTHKFDIFVARRVEESIFCPNFDNRCFSGLEGLGFFAEDNTKDSFFGCELFLVAAVVV
jgi:hypothetical protein